MRRYQPPWTIDEILDWADAHFKRTGRWPHGGTGAVAECPDITWGMVNRTLERGGRGLPGGSSLSALLDERRGPRSRGGKALLTIEQILAWAWAHRARTGQWPSLVSGTIAECPGLTWRQVHSALWHGSRGLSGGDTLARLLRRYREGQTKRRSPQSTGTHQSNGG